MSKPIEIDLRRDLPKVREQLEAILPNMGRCSYAAPCVVGAMAPKHRRAKLDRTENKFGSSMATAPQLVEVGALSIPADQIADIGTLQSIFDNCRKETFLDALARLEAKYLTGEVG